MGSQTKLENSKKKLKRKRNSQQAWALSSFLGRTGAGGGGHCKRQKRKVVPYGGNLMRVITFDTYIFI